MTIYLGANQIQGIKLGTQDVSKIYLGSTEVWSSTPSGPGLYTEDNGATLVVGTSYSIPTEIYHSDDTTETTTTTLSTPIKISNLTSSSYGANYNYYPQLSSQIQHTSFDREHIKSDSYTYLDNIYGNRTKTTSYPSVSYSARVGTQSSGNRFQQYSNYAIKPTDIPAGYENAKFSMNILMSGYDSSSAGHMDATLQVLGSDGTTVLAESSITNKEIKTTSTYVSIPRTPEITIPSTGLKFNLNMVKTDAGSSGVISMNTGKMNFWLIKYSYDTPLYCNISRTIHEQWGDDSLNISISSTDSGSQYMISLSEQGIATITDKQ